jgi:hypothetical protein
VLEGGVTESDIERSLSPVTAALMTATVSDAAMAAIGAGRLLQHWVSSGLLEPDAGAYRLTAAGSCFLAQLRGQAIRHSHSHTVLSPAGTPSTSVGRNALGS